MCILRAHSRANHRFQINLNPKVHWRVRIPPVTPMTPMNPMNLVTPMTPMTPMHPMNPMNPMNLMHPMNLMTPMTPTKPMKPMTPNNPMHPSRGSCLAAAVVLAFSGRLVLRAGAGGWRPAAAEGARRHLQRRAGAWLGLVNWCVVRVSELVRG